jgi:hypothetical protein
MLIAQANVLYVAGIFEMEKYKKRIFILTGPAFSVIFCLFSNGRTQIYQ